MVIAPENLPKVIEKLAGPPETFSEEEEKAYQKYMDLIDGNEQLAIWKKYVHKSLVIRVLRFCNMDPDLTFKTVKEVHDITLKSYPDLLATVDPTGIKGLFEKKVFQLVKRPDNKGPLVIVMRFENWHISDGHIEDLGIAAFLYSWALETGANRGIMGDIQDANNGGVIFIGDMSGFKLKHARQVSLDWVKMSLKFYSCIPKEVKDRGVEICKGAIAFASHGIVEETYNLFKGILPKEIKNMIHITKKDSSIITKIVPAERLPVEFGGKIPDAEAYMDGLEDMILKEQEMFDLLKQIQEEALQQYGIKKKERKPKKEKKDKKGKAEEENGKKVIENKA